MGKVTKLQTWVTFAGLEFKGLRAIDLFPEVGQFKFIVTVNADFIVTAKSNKRFASLICSNLSTFDGQVTWWLARCLARPRRVAFEKISGSSFANALLERAGSSNDRVFFLGATQEVNEAARRKAAEQFGLEVSGYSPPQTAYPPSDSWNADVLARICAESPRILLVALGAPKQEFWIEDHREQLKSFGVELAMGCGGTLDFLAGTIQRAPAIVQRIGLEGLFRLAMEPRWFRVKRLARSILVLPIAIRDMLP